MPYSEFITIITPDVVVFDVVVTGFVISWSYGSCACNFSCYIVLYP